MRIPVKKQKGEVIYKQPEPEIQMQGILDVSNLPILQQQTLNLNEKIREFFKYVEVRNGTLYFNCPLKSSNFVRNLKGWGLSINKNGDAYFTTVIAGAYVQVFIQADIPVSLHINDLWYDSDNNNKLYKAASVGADAIAAGEWVAVDLTVEWANVADGAATKPENNADVTLTEINSGLILTGGGFTLNAGGSLKGGQTDYATGTGFFIGYSGAAYKLSLGDATNYFKWDGLALHLSGTLDAPSGYLGHIILCSVCHGYISSGLETYNSGVGFWLGNDVADSEYKFSIESDAGEKLLFDQANLRLTYNWTPGIDITAGQAVYMGTDSKVYPTNAYYAAQTNAFVGFATADADADVDVAVPIQTFGNFMGISGLTIGSEYYLKNSTHTIDQSQVTNDSQTTIITTESVWQSFTTGAGVTHISEIAVGITKTDGTPWWVKARIREGAGITGTLIGTSPAVTAIATTTITFTNPLVVSPSTVYSICLYAENATGLDWNRKATTNPYAGGRASTSANDDFYFETHYYNVTGAIDTSAGTNSKKVGLATPATSLLIKNT